ncbi:MAG: formimidoylglutamase [Bdellovibrionales bacterium CG10_big_fil_rev_8_21_14_0_10_45_34]|nr:MAG: formimidoylglutamase [Bdellovibrionales bacterium CG10_big_fil_rev_8_21_14_0_10_45_34]
MLRKEHLNYLTPIDEELLYPSSEEDPRVSCWVKKTELSLAISANAVAIMGYPDDYGVQLNKGRTGASLGPTEIRRALYKMTANVFQNENPEIVDLGDLPMHETSQKERHAVAREIISSLVTQNTSCLTFGGGHDYAYSDVAGFLDACKNLKTQKPLIINIDAHLDVRTYSEVDKSSHNYNSGTPFRRIIEEFGDFSDMAVVGIQSQCNSRAHLRWAQDHGIRILSLDEILLGDQPAKVAITQFFSGLLTQKRPVFLSVDIDGFSSAYAPGCSQSFPCGLSPQSVLPALKIAMTRSSFSSMGIYEVSPPLDQDARTSKLAAQIAHMFLSSSGLR